MVEIDPEKQFVEDVETVTDTPKEDYDERVEAPKDITKYGLVADIAKNGMVLLWVWKPIKEARKQAEYYQERI